MPRRRKLDGDVYLWLFNTHTGLSGGCSTTAALPPAMLTQGLRCPLPTPREGLLFGSALWQCLWVMSASSYEKQQVQKQSVHWCAGRDWWGRIVVGSLGAQAPPEGHRLLSRARGSLPPPLTPATLKRILLQKK